MEKTAPIQRLSHYLLNKYGSENILVKDYWDADLTAIGLTDKTNCYLVYIRDMQRDDLSFSVSLENPALAGSALPYSQGAKMDNLSADEVEKIVVKHLNLSF